MSEDRVRQNSADSVNRKIDEDTASRIRAWARASPGELSARIRELDREWDIERVLETNASAIAFAGLVLGATENRKWFLLPGIVLPFLFLHATQGWCPPLPILRRLGIRTRGEIDEEKYALKALRGDFREIGAAPGFAIAAARK